MTPSHRFGTKPAGHRPQRLGIQTLEDRCTPAAAYIQAGTLQIIGDETTDYAFVSEYTIESVGFVRVHMNSVVSDFLKSSLPKGIRFHGNGGDDWLDNNTSIAVQAWGGAGNDWLEGGSAADRLNGEDGNDLLVGNAGNDNLSGEDGDDSFDAGADVDTLTGGAGNDYMDGGDQTDKILGSAGDDILVGDGGNDSLYGGAGNDRMTGGPDKDYLTGDDGNDTMEGGDGNDSLYGRRDNDKLHGDDGNDTLIGHEGNDRLWGGDGKDRLEGHDGNDDLYGQDGNDRLYGGAGDDGLCGGTGVDYVNGSTGDDRFLLFWEAGVDELSEVTDYNSHVDAHVSFVPGAPGMGGKDWTYEEVEAVDAALALLHHHPLTQHTRLLKRLDGSPLIFDRNDVIPAEAIPDGYDVDPDHVGAYNPGIFPDESSAINVYDYGFTFGIVPTILEVIGLDWASASVNEQWDEFIAISGWTKDEPNPFGPAFEKAQGGWFYLAGAGFVDPLAQTNPTQDWAATFAYYFATSDTHDNDDVQAKLDTVAAFLATLTD
jgi:hypothetical protein